MLMNINVTGLQSSPVHLHVESKVVEPTVLGKSTILAYHHILKIVADGDSTWSSSKEVGREQHSEGTGESSLPC